MRSKMALSAEEWSFTQFGRVRLGDERRTQRVVRLAAQMLRRPSASIPAQTGRWSDTKASYRLFDQDEVTFDALGKNHWQATRTSARSRTTTLMIQDTTDLSFSHREDVIGLGPVGNGEGQGFILHSTLAVDPTGSGEVLGLACQFLLCRDGIHPEETRSQRKHRRRESEIWGQSVVAIGRSEEQSRWIHVCDRYADNFEMFEACRRTQVDFVIRMAQDRRCAPTHEDAKASKRLMQWVRTLPAVGHKTLELRQRPGRHARLARLSVAYSAVTIFVPKFDRSTLSPWRGWVVRVWEPNTPEDEESIEWVLLTSVLVESAGQAEQIAGWYSLRWLVEEYHKCLKTGCQVEARQMETRGRLEACIGILALIAVRLLQLKLWARSAPQDPAAKCASSMHVRVLSAYYNIPTGSMTANEFWRKVAQLGGFLGRRSDGDPGWQTLWRGWLQLDAMTQGASLLQSENANCG